VVKKFFSLTIVAVGLFSILGLGYVAASIGGAVTNNPQLAQEADEMKDTLLQTMGLIVFGSVIVAFFGYRWRNRR
jgi:hypothetical protein